MAQGAGYGWPTVGAVAAGLLGYAALVYWWVPRRSPRLRAVLLVGGASLAVAMAGVLLGRGRAPTVAELALAGALWLLGLAFTALWYRRYRAADDGRGPGGR